MLTVIGPSPTGKARGRQWLRLRDHPVIPSGGAGITLVVRAAALAFQRRRR